ncbi:HPr family phosphocarrier protein [Bifidobacterium longum]|nr:HPr family phosphocarrier protein [Bifidobacterium longum]
MPQIFTFTVPDPEGMHARPAGRLVAKAQEYESSITVACGGKWVS